MNDLQTPIETPAPAPAKPKVDSSRQLIARTVRKAQKRMMSIEEHPYLIAAMGTDKHIAYASNLEKDVLKRFLQIMLEKL